MFYSNRHFFECSAWLAFLSRIMNMINYPAIIYLFKANNRNNRSRCEICSKWTIKTPERHRWQNDDFRKMTCMLIFSQIMQRKYHVTSIKYNITKMMLPRNHVVFTFLSTFLKPKVNVRLSKNKKIFIRISLALFCVLCHRCVSKYRWILMDSVVHNLLWPRDESHNTLIMPKLQIQIEGRK